MPLLRALILLVWIVPMLAGALACLLVQGVAVGWDIMADWIERIEP
jgi:hypothetical protein